MKLLSGMNADEMIASIRTNNLCFGQSGISEAAAEKAVKTTIDEGADLSVELILQRSLRCLTRV
jgi:hypothetical protein